MRISIFVLLLTSQALKLFLLLITTTLVAACGGGSDGSDITPTPKPSAQVNGIWLGKFSESVRLLSAMAGLKLFCKMEGFTRNAAPVVPFMSAATLQKMAAYAARTQFLKTTSLPVTPRLMARTTR